MASGIPPGRANTHDDAGETATVIRVAALLVSAALFIGLVPALVGMLLDAVLVGVVVSVTLLAALVCVSAFGSAWYLTTHGIDSADIRTVDDLTARETEMIAIYKLTHRSML